MSTEIRKIQIEQGRLALCPSHPGTTWRPWLVRIDGRIAYYANGRVAAHTRADARALAQAVAVGRYAVEFGRLPGHAEESALLTRQEARQ
jgi:hypothetical protein